jgi:uncharacterized protein
MSSRWLSILACMVLFTPPPSPAGVLEEHYGKWLGTLAIPQGPQLRTGIELFARADGSPGAILVSPDQAPMALPVDRVQIANGQIHLMLSMLGIDLNLQPDGAALVGQVRQGPMVAPLRLERVASFGEPVRPQTPKPPFPYEVETLVVSTPDGTRLSGTLTRPRGATRGTAVVLLQGSGPIDRDESMGGHHPFAVLADYLTRRGITVYRFDKRGVARSTGVYASETNATLLRDALAATRAIRARHDVSRVGVIGHSEGAAVAAELAAKYPKDVAFLVSLAGPGLKGMDEIVLQDRTGYQRRGLSPSQVEMLMDYGRRFYAIVVSTDDVDARTKALLGLGSNLSATDSKLVLQYASTGSLSIANARTPHLREVLSSDMSQYWHAVRCPVLVLNGSLDVQVPAPENPDAIRSALSAGGNGTTQVETLPRLNHLFQSATTGLGDEYTRIDETMAPAALEAVARFVAARQ